MLKELTIQLENTQQKLADLQDQLPFFHGLLTDSQQKEVGLQKAFREGKGNFNDLTAAKTATTTAKELLEAQESDLAHARQELEHLQAQVDRENRRVALIAVARKANKHAKALEKEADALNTLLLERMESLLAHSRAVRDAKRSFSIGLRELGYNPNDSLRRIEGDEEQELHLIEFLKDMSREVDLDVVAVPAERLQTGLRLYWQQEEPELPQPFGPFLEHGLSVHVRFKDTPGGS